MLLTFRDFFQLSEGTEAALGLGITLILTALPGAIADIYYIGREGKILSGINSFLRDLVETRKSGLAPERCILALTNRDYGAFSKYLKIISMKINWGYPLRQIYEEFKEKYPKGSKELKYFRDYTSYQELIGVLVLKGLLSEDLIFDLWGSLVWKKLEPIVYGMRKEIEMPRYLENFEVLAKRYPEWAKNNPPKV